jgi:predicted RNase H-like HicB family nuclease
MIFAKKFDNCLIFKALYGIFRIEVIYMKKRYQLPIFIEKDEDGFYVVECPVFSGCYSQGKTMDQAMKNIREVIDLCLEEKENKQALNYTLS